MRHWVHAVRRFFGDALRLRLAVFLSFSYVPIWHIGPCLRMHSHVACRKQTAGIEVKVRQWLNFRRLHSLCFGSRLIAGCGVVYAKGL